MNQNRYILFLDESGKSKLSDGEGSFLLSGLIINKDLHEVLSSYMVSLKNKSGIPADANIHAFDLFEKEKIRDRDSSGKVVQKNIKTGSLKSFFSRLSSLIEGSEMRCVIFRIDKKSYKIKIKTAARKKNMSEKSVIAELKKIKLDDFLYEALARRIILEFGHFLEQEDAQGEVMAESRRNDDDAVLRAFLAATSTSAYSDGSFFTKWAQSGFKRIQSLTFQNKKGLSFGLEIADLFGWAHYNKHYGRHYPISDVNHQKRVEQRIKKASLLAYNNCQIRKPENLSQYKVKRIANDRVSEFTETLKNLPASSLFGDPSRKPEGP